MKDLIEQHFLSVTFVLVCAWYFGFVMGKWWERLKDEVPPEHNDEIWW